MGQHTYLMFGASASLRVKVSMARILSVIEQIRLHESSVEVYEQFTKEGETFVREYGEEEEEEHEHEQGTPPASRSQPDLIIFVVPCRTLSVYSLDDMRNPFVYNQEDMSAAEVVGSVARGQDVLRSLGFTDGEIQLGWTMRNTW